MSLFVCLPEATTVSPLTFPARCHIPVDKVIYSCLINAGLESKQLKRIPASWSNRRMVGESVGPAMLGFYGFLWLLLLKYGTWSKLDFYGRSWLAGWWFGTCFIFPYIGNLIIPTDFHIFQRGWNHQLVVNFWSFRAEFNLSLFWVCDAVTG